MLANFSFEIDIKSLTLKIVDETLCSGLSYHDLNQIWIQHLGADGCEDQIHPGESEEQIGTAEEGSKPTICNVPIGRVPSAWKEAYF
jgi:hypothetical protein